MPPVLVAGNKCDLDPKDRRVSPETGKQLAQELGGNTNWAETSAKTNVNVHAVFADLIKRIQAEEANKLKEAKKKKKRCNIM